MIFVQVLMSTPKLSSRINVGRGKQLILSLGILKTIVINDILIHGNTSQLFTDIHVLGLYYIPCNKQTTMTKHS